MKFSGGSAPPGAQNGPRERIPHHRSASPANNYSTQKAESARTTGGLAYRCGLALPELNWLDVSPWREYGGIEYGGLPVGDKALRLVLLLPFTGTNRNGHVAADCPHECDKCPDTVARADNSRMSTALWILVAVLAVGIIAGGLLRIRAWLRRPAPPEIIDAARRRNEQDDRSPD